MGLFSNTQLEMNIYAICGHGTEPIESITVPEGCMLVVRQNPGCYMSKRDYDQHMKSIMCNKDITSSLHDPLGNLDMIRKVFGPVMIFKAGDKCPNFRFKLIVDYHFPTSISFGKLAGIIPITSDSASDLCHTLSDVSDELKQSIIAPPKFVPANITDPKFKVFADMPQNKRAAIQPMINTMINMETTRRKDQYNYEIKKLQKPDVAIAGNLPAASILPLFYQHSIYPTKDTVTRFLDDESLTINDIIDDSAFEELITIDAKSMFKKYPGVYYHFVCRLSEDPDISETLFNVNMFPTYNEMLYNHRQVPAVYNTPILQMPVSKQHYIKQSIYEAERKKQFGKGRQTQRQKRKVRKTMRSLNHRTSKARR